MFAKLNMFIGLLLISAVTVASPEIHSWEERGAKVLFVQAPELPMVDISVVFNAGAARDGKMSGLAKLTNAMLDEGAAEMNADQIADSFAAVGAKYSGSSERDMAVLELRSLTEPAVFNNALATFATVVSKPTFPESSFNRLKQQLLRGLEAEKQSPDALAAREFY
jgi:zinc protease